MVNKENFQWIWAILSWFKKNIPKKEILKYDFPKPEGHTDFWKNAISIQYSLAEI